MKARSKKFLSLLLATAMVFTLNTTVFAEEVAVDSVEDAVEATVDAVDEVAEEATVDAVVDATGAADFFDDHLNYEKKDGVDTLTSEITFSADPSNKKDTTEKVVKITGVDDPISWCNINKENGFDYGVGGQLIETVLTGASKTDTSLVNDKKLTISNNLGGTSEEDLKFYNKLSQAYRTYDVVDLGSGSYLFVGYGSSEYEDGNTNYDAAKLVGVDDKLVPVFEYDGRQIDYDKSGDAKMSASKREVLDVDVALVKYEGTTLTEIAGGASVAKVTVDKKNNKNATVSDASIPVEYKWKEKVGDTEVEHTINPMSWAAVNGATNPTFTIKVKVGKDAKDLKKTIGDKMKDQKYAFAISQRNVSIVRNSMSGRSAWTQLWDNPDPVFTTQNDAKATISSSTINAFEKGDLFSSSMETEELWFDSFVMSKFTDKKVDLGIAVTTWNGKTSDVKVNKLKAGTDYELTDGTLAGGETVKVLDFKGNFVYTDNRSNTTDLAANGYKWAFRQTPEKNGKKQKTFRFGVYRGTNDGFVYNVDETAVDSVEEVF